MSEFKLNNFQETTVRHILNYFKEHNVYLLADETGIGKTVIASEVAKRMTEEREKPQSVLYIASSLELASENIEKLQFEGSEVIKGRLSMLWKDLKKYESEKTKLFALTPAVSLKMESNGTEIERDACKKEYVKLPKSQNNELVIKIEQICKEIDCLEKEMKKIDFLSELSVYEKRKYYCLLERNKNKSTQYLAKLTNVVAKKYKEIKYAFSLEEDIKLIAQEVIALCLTENVLNYMLYEEQSKELDKILKLPAIKEAVENVFPDDSTSVGRMYFEILWGNSKKIVTNNYSENVKEFISWIAKEIGNKWENIFCEIKNHKEIYYFLLSALNEIYTKEYDKLIRCYMAHYSLTTFVKPDVVIIDEIQNYPQVFSNTADTDEAAIVIQSILNEVLGKNGEDSEKKDVKVLMLSATPYAYRNAIEVEAGALEIDEIEEFTQHLVGMEEILSYMKEQNHIKDVDIKASWANVQTMLNQLLQSSQNAINQVAFEAAKDAVKKLSSDMLILGISRSERPKKNFKPDEGKYTLNKVDISEFANYFIKGKRTCGTRLTMSLPREIGTESIKRIGYKLFDDSVRKVEIEANGRVESSRVNALMEDLFQENMSFYLFMPPNKPSHELLGIYENSQRKYGKTLLFSAYNAVPQCLKECVEQHLYEKLLKKSGWSQEKYEEMFLKLTIPSLKEYLNLMVDDISEQEKADTIRGLKDVTDDTQEQLYAIFTSSHAKRVILSLYKEEAVKDYCACVDRYCIDGNLSAVMQEFAYMCSIQKKKVTVDACMKKAAVVDAKSFSVAYCSSAVENFKEKIRAFNNPFYPFAFFITSMAEEGHDFHWYSDRIVHWNVPISPISLIQREGRIDRADCMSIRKAIAEDMKDDLKFGQMSWKNLISKFDEKNRDIIRNELYKDMFPKFITGEKENRIYRMCYYYPLSNEYFRWEILMKNLEYYRSMFGASDNVQLEELRRIFEDDDIWELLKQLELNIQIKK